MSRKKTGRVLSTLFPKAKLHNHNTIDALNQREINGSISTKYFPDVWGIFICFILSKRENQQTRLGDYKLIKMDRQKFIRPNRQMVRISREKLIIPERESATQRMLAGLQRETKTADIAKTEKTANENIAEAVNAANKNIENAVNTAATEHLQTKQPEIAEAVNKPENSIVLACEIDEVINYALVHNGASVVRDICIKNTSETERNALLLKIASDGELMEDFVCGIEALQTGEELHFRNLDLTFHVGYLASITEKFSGQLTVTVLDGETVLASEKINITVMAFDEFPGFQYTPELLTSFAMPNHPAVVSLIQLASKYLEKWTGDPSLDGYQSGDQERVKNMAAAAYAAIQQKNITYASTASFEACGQRVRLADAVLEQHFWKLHGSDAALYGMSGSDGFKSVHGGCRRSYFCRCLAGGRSVCRYSGG